MTDFTRTRDFFDIPDGVVYLDGNSLGPLPKTVPARLQDMLTAEWGAKLITAWNAAGWADLPARVGDRIAPLIGAAPGTVTTGDTLTIKVYQALAAGLEMRPDRHVILSDSGNFPTDLYMAQGLIHALAKGHELRVVAPEAVADAITDEVAVMMLTEVDYRTGRRHDMPRLIERAQSAGAVTVWDLAHSAGAFPVDVTGTGAEFAVGCTYKYLNGGPGAPAFIYVRPDLTDRVRPALSGWFGHESPFAFDLDYRPADGVTRMRVGTPPVIGLTALDTALDVWDAVNLADIRARSVELSERFIRGVEAACPALALASPRDAANRGSQVSFRHPEGYAIMQAIIDRGVIGDFRAPDILRFGITPLYLGETEIDRAIGILAEVMDGDLWDRDDYKRRAAVT